MTLGYPQFSNHGWNYLGEIEWIKDDAFPTEIQDILLDNDDSDEEIGSDVESDLESDLEISGL